MTKTEFIEFLKDVPDEAFIMVDTEDGILPFCEGDTHLAKGEDGEIALVICPCYCGIDEAMEEEIASNPLERVISECDEPELN